MIDSPEPDSAIKAATGSPSPLTKRRRHVLLATAGLLGTTLLGWLGLKTWTRTGIPADAPRIGASLDTAWHARLGISTTNYEIALARSQAHLEGVRSTDVDPDEFLDRIDGLLLTGGGDVDPALYSASDDMAELVDRQRDDFEIALYRGAIQRGMPVLGICRGIQLINVIHGGTLQNLRQDPELSTRHGIGLASMTAHPITVTRGSQLAEILGRERLEVNSFHGQAVDQLGQGLTVVARAEDGVVEAIERPGQPFVLCTQWHPEVPPQQTAIFETFLEAARRYRENTRSDSTPQSTDASP